MRPVITPTEAARLDEACPDPEAVLLERAGMAVARVAREEGAQYGRKVIVLAGPGNNGGDGWVAARYLKRAGVDVAVRSLGYPRGDGSPRRAAAIAAVHAGVPVADLGPPEGCDLIVDALFGAGFHGSLPERVARWVESDAPVIAVDLPSGLDGATGTVEGPTFRAAATVTFQAPKVGHLVGEGPDLIGRLVVAEIGLGDPTPAWKECEDPDAVVPPRLRRAHKWSAGSVVVVGGSPGIAGAAVLSGRSALEFGAGAVRLLVPGGIAGDTSAMDPGVMTAGIGDGRSFEVGDVDAVLDASSRFDAMVMGPGLGAGCGEFVRGVLAGWDKPVVLDADALVPEVATGLTARSAATVVTPHAAEFERFTGKTPTLDSVPAAASRLGIVVLLKGSPTLVVGEDRWMVTAGSQALATIGTGDVLSGMIGALIARGASPEQAARAAAHRHGRAGRNLQGLTTVTATGLAEEIGRWAW